MEKFVPNANYHKRKSNLLRNLVIIFSVLLIMSAIGAGVYFSLKKYYSSRVTVKTLEKYWEVYDYQSVYDNGKLYLYSHPFNNSALIYYGYSAFYLAVSQTDSSVSQKYFDDAIVTLRLALDEASESIKPQIYYMLGRSYFYKNTNPSYYYADLAIKYLSLAMENGYKPVPNDIPEYLGLSYASLGMTMESISSFTEALLERESDTLLLSIAEQYYKAGEKNAAKQYLVRVIGNTIDQELMLKSKCLLANICFDEEDFETAEKQYTEILEIDDRYADAVYGMGLIYEQQGKTVLARAQWRKTLRLQVNHAGALKKMAER